jgi:hypothetical protein
MGGCDHNWFTNAPSEPRGSRERSIRRRIVPDRGVGPVAVHATVATVMTAIMFALSPGTTGSASVLRPRQARSALAISRPGSKADCIYSAQSIVVLQSFERLVAAGLGNSVIRLAHEANVLAFAMRMTSRPAFRSGGCGSRDQAPLGAVMTPPTSTASRASSGAAAWPTRRTSTTCHRSSCSAAVASACLHTAVTSARAETALGRPSFQRTRESLPAFAPLHDRATAPPPPRCPHRTQGGE